MAGRNGAAPLTVLPPGRRRFNAVPKTITFEIEVPGADGATEIVEVVGYHKDAPEVWVEVQVQQAWRDWREASYRPNTERKEVFDLDLGKMTVPDTLFVESDEAEGRFRRDMLLAVTKGMQEHHADVLARDGGDWKPILQLLGYWRADAEESPDPEAGGGEATAPTGDASSPSSRRRTARTTGST